MISASPGAIFAVLSVLMAVLLLLSTVQDPTGCFQVEGLTAIKLNARTPNTGNRLVALLVAPKSGAVRWP